MANYNTFVVYDCKKRHNCLITSSARKAGKELCVGVKIEVWNENQKIETIYSKQSDRLREYIKLEKEFITKKQHKAELRNEKRRRKNGL